MVMLDIHSIDEVQTSIPGVWLGCVTRLSSCQVQLVWPWPWILNLQVRLRKRSLRVSKSRTKRQVSLGLKSVQRITTYESCKVRWAQVLKLSVTPRHERSKPFNVYRVALTSTDQSQNKYSFMHKCAKSG